MRTLILKGTHKGVLGSLIWAIFWLLVVCFIWSWLDSVRMDEYARLGITSFVEVSEYKHGINTMENIMTCLFAEWSFVLVGMLVVFLVLSNFLYTPTHVTEIGYSEEGGRTLKWKQMEFPFTLDGHDYSFSRIQSVENTQTWLQRLTNTQTLKITLVVMKGAKAEYLDICIFSIAVLTNEQNAILNEYKKDYDVHHVEVKNV
jgi:hypothetical protein